MKPAHWIPAVGIFGAAAMLPVVKPLIRFADWVTTSAIVALTLGTIVLIVLAIAATAAVRALWAWWTDDE